MLFCIFVFTSCSLQKIPLASNNKPNTIYYSDKSREEVWGKIIELFARNGIGISLIDKSSGLIVSYKTNFSNRITQENDKGELINPNAYVVSSKVLNSLGMNIFPNEATGSWNIRLFEDKGRTAIEVNLTNIEVTYVERVGMSTNHVSFDAKSTKVFEQEIAEYIK